MKALLVLALLPFSALGQTIAVRPVTGAPLAAPAPLTFSPVPLGVSVLPSLSLSPSLAASFIPLPAPALAAVIAPAAATPERPKGTPRAKEELAKASAEFSRLVAELMGPDRAASDAAAASLMKLKDEHLNVSPDYKKTRILDLKPMQIPAGMIEVQDKARDLRDMKPKQLDAWLKERSVPVLEDYKGRKRPVDHHHEARAAWEANIDDAYTHQYFDDEMHARIKELTREQYYAVTRAMGLFYDRDQFGAGPHDPNHLPEDVRSLADDPFRSVAWAVRKKGGYDKSAIPFAEFKWAQYFRERVAIYPTRADFDKAVAEAMKIVHDPAARDIPGWKPR